MLLENRPNFAEDYESEFKIISYSFKNYKTHLGVFFNLLHDFEFTNFFPARIHNFLIT